MKYYKLSNDKILKAKNEKPLIYLGHLGEDSYYQSGESLKSPFIKVEELPAEIKEKMQAMLKDVKEKKLNLAKKAVESIKSFQSSVLGTPHSYDLDEQDQINLSQAREYLSNTKAKEVKIRCVNEDGIKDNRAHTLEQINGLFKEWYEFKSRTLDAFSVFKLEMSQAISEDCINKAYEKFVASIGGE